MGEIVGAALVAHVPTIVMPEAERRELNGGPDTSLVAGLRRIRREFLDPLDPDTVVVVDTHWLTTFEHCITAHERRAGRYTSDELPRGMAGVPYDFPGDPELARLAAKVGEETDGTWVHATDDPYLPMHYPTVNLLGLLQRAERWVCAGVCQTAEVHDFVRFGEVLAQAVAQTDRRVVVLASGGMSHRFWPLRELRDHEGSDPVNIVSPEARGADERVLSMLLDGDHAGIIETMDEYLAVSPEGRFGHYLVMAGAIGGRRCRARGVQCSDYESAAGTGQVHVFFPRPDGGWTAGPLA